MNQRKQGPLRSLIWIRKAIHVPLPLLFLVGGALIHNTIKHDWPINAFSMFILFVSSLSIWIIWNLCQSLPKLSSVGRGEVQPSHTTTYQKNINWKKKQPDVYIKVAQLWEAQIEIQKHLGLSYESTPISIFNTMK